MDPCLNTNNLGRSISLFNAHRLKEALKLQRKAMSEEIFVHTSAQKYFERLVDVFKYTFEMCNVLPPHSIHMPQVTALASQSHQSFDETTDVTASNSEFVDINAVLRARNCRLQAMADSELSNSLS